MILTEQHPAVLLAYHRRQAHLAALTPIKTRETDCRKTGDGLRKREHTHAAHHETTFPLHNMHSEDRYTRKVTLEPNELRGLSRRVIFEQHKIKLCYVRHGTGQHEPQPAHHLKSIRSDFEGEDLYEYSFHVVQQLVMVPGLHTSAQSIARQASYNVGVWAKLMLPLKSSM